jgi:hypothetical protein
MSNVPSDLDQLAYDYDHLDQEADRAWQIAAKAKATAELAEACKNTARGSLRDALSKAKAEAPCTIAIAGTCRLLTIYEDGYGLSFIITTAPKPQ